MGGVLEPQPGDSPWLDCQREVEAAIAVARKALPWWLWPNVLSLDAPVIALVWQDLAYRTHGLAPSLAGRAALGLAVWSAYLLDRLLDTGRGGSATPRHQFHARHRHALGALVVANLALVALCASQLPRAATLRGLLLSAVAALYLLVFARVRLFRPWKHPMAALLFAAGVLVIPGIAVPVEWLALAALCFANLRLLDHWEHAAPSPIPAMLIALVLGAVSTGAWRASALAAAAALVILERWGGRLGADARRVLADTVLLAPLLFR